MYNNPYINGFNSQQSVDRINTQIAELEKMKDQLSKPITQPTNLTQNFQISPASRDFMKYANSMEEVQREMVYVDTPFFTKDMTVLWVKNAKGEIKTYELNEIVNKDEKDLKIDYLMAQIEDLKKEMKKNECNSIIDGAITNTIESKEPSNVSTISKFDKKSK